MKYRFTIIWALILGAFAFTSCTSEDDILKNRLFINAKKFNKDVPVAVDEKVDSLSEKISLSLAKPLDKNLEIRFVVEDGLLDKYRKANNDEEAELLPKENCNIDGTTTKIKAGDITSPDVTVKFVNLTNLDYSKKYVMPLSIKCDNMSILKGAETMYYVIRESSIINVVAEMKDNRAWPEWGGFDKVENLESFTMEVLLNAHAFDNDSKIHTIMGIEDHFLVRVGDATIPKNQIQIATAYKDVEGNSVIRRNLTNEDLQLKTDRWYHLAVTFDKGNIEVYLDGKKKASEDFHILGQRKDKDGNDVDIIFKNVNFKVPHSEEDDGKPRCFWLGYSYDHDRSFDGMICEARLWNRVLSEEEINEKMHFYKIYNPDRREDLLAYWKFNEGAGKHIKDYSSYGNDLEGENNFVWYPVSLPE